jgi:hypothetical protein
MSLNNGSGHSPFWDPSSTEFKSFQGGECLCTLCTSGAAQDVPQQSSWAIRARDADHVWSSHGILQLIRILTGWPWWSWWSCQWHVELFFVERIFWPWWSWWSCQWHVELFFVERIDFYFEYDEIALFSHQLVMWTPKKFQFGRGDWIITGTFHPMWRLRQLGRSLRSVPKPKRLAGSESKQTWMAGGSWGVMMTYIIYIHTYIYMLIMYIYIYKLKSPKWNLQPFEGDSLN